MLESMINPKRLIKGPWKMFFIGLLYGSLSLLLVKWMFSSDPVLYEFSGMIVVLFAVMFSLPFMYFIIRKEEELDEQVEGFFQVWRIHKDAIYALMWLFFGLLIAFSVMHVGVLKDPNLFNAQIGTYCAINSPGSIESCIKDYSAEPSSFTGAATGDSRFLSIIVNNVYVMMFTLMFSLIFGAGAIFILAWNASVIATAIGVFSRYQLSELPLGLARYMIHGVPEIASYFITALAGGMFGVGILRHGIRSRMSLRVLENTVVLLFIALLILIFAAVIETFVTPILF